MNNIKEIHNIYNTPENLEKILFSKNDRTIIRQLKKYASVICRGCINNDYINTSFYQFSDGYLYKSGDNILGFCIWKFIKSPNNKKYLYIILICTELNKYKLGTQMLFDIEHIAIINNVDTIKLQTNENVSKFYKSIGFIEGSYNIKKELYNYSKTIQVIEVKIRNKTLKRSSANYIKSIKRKTLKKHQVNKKK
jgi:hypothetical protein